MTRIYYSYNFTKEIDLLWKCKDDLSTTILILSFLTNWKRRNSTSAIGIQSVNRFSILQMFRSILCFIFKIKTGSLFLEKNDN